MIKVLWILPDNIIKPTGGMGIYAQNMYKTLKNLFDNQIDISILSRDNITTSIITGTQNDINLTLLSQCNIIENALQLNKKFDIIHACDWGTAYSSISLKNIFKSKLIYNIHLNIKYALQGFDTRLIEDIETSTMNKSDAIIHVSNYYANLYPSIYKQKSIVIQNGINIDEWKPTQDITLPGKNNIKVIYIGRFTYMKNIQNILNTKTPNNIDLIFIGNITNADPMLITEIKNKTKENNFFLIEPQYNQNKINYLCKANAVIMPSIHEPFGIVALEAMASKSILLTSREGGLDEFVPKEYTINCGTSINTITEALYKLSHMNTNEYKYMTENAYEHVKQYTWEKQAKKLASLYYYLHNKGE